MFRGTLSFMIGEDYLGIAATGLKGPLFPAVSCVWGGAHVSLNYCGSED